MKLVIAFLLALVSAAAQISLTGVTKTYSSCSGTASGGSGTITCTMQQREIMPTPPPAVITVHETGAGSDTISISETSSPSQFANWDVTSTICSAPYTQASSPGEPCNAVTSVSAGTDVEIRIINTGFYTIGAVAPWSSATFTFTVTDQHAGSYTISLTYTLTSATQPTVTYPGGSQTGCSGSVYPAAIYPVPTTCNNPSNLNPTGSAVSAPPTIGGTYVDANFGATVHMDMPFASSTSANSGTNDVEGGSCDSIMSCVNSDGTLAMTAGFTPWSNQNPWVTYLHKSGQTGRFTIAAPDFGTDASNFDSWSATNRLRYFQTSGMSLVQTDIAASPNASCQTTWTEPACGVSTTIFTDTTTNGTSISGGHDGQVSKDDWWAFVVVLSSGDPVVGLVNLKNTAQVFHAAWPTEWQGNGFGRRSAMLSPGVSSATGNRYILITPGPPGAGQYAGNVTLALYAFNTNTNTLTYKGLMPIQAVKWGASPAWANVPGCTSGAFVSQVCVQSGHLTIGEGCSGGVCKEFLFRGTNDNGQNGLTFTVQDLDTWPNTEVAAEVSGGGSYPAYISSSPSNDFHTSCNTKGGYCLASTTSLASVAVNTYRIGSLSANGVTPVHVTENAGDSPQFNGACSSIVVGGAVGNTALNGQAWTISNYAAGPPASFDIAAATGNGTFVSNTGLFTCNTAQPTVSGHGEIIGIDLNYLVGHNKQMKVNRLARTMELYPTNTNGSMINYYNQSHINTSGDGSVGMWATNLGIPEQSNILSIDTGFSATLTPTTVISGSTVVSGKTTIQ